MAVLALAVGLCETSVSRLADAVVILLFEFLE